MATPNIEADNTRLLIIVAAGILTVTAAAWTFISKRLDKIRSASPKDRTLTTTLGCFAIGLCAFGSLLVWLFDSLPMGIAFLALGAFTVAASYLRLRTPPSRQETFMLVVTMCGLTFVVLVYHLSRVLEMFGHLTNTVAPK